MADFSSRKPHVHMVNARMAYGRLFGDVLDHPRLGAMKHIGTSLIVKIWKNRRTVTTLNTIYHLDAPLPIGYDQSIVREHTDAVAIAARSLLKKGPERVNE